MFQGMIFYFILEIQIFYTRSMLFECDFSAFQDSAFNLVSPLSGFSLASRIWGKGSVIHSPPVLQVFLGFLKEKKWRSAHANYFHSIYRPGSIHSGSAS